MNEGLFPVIIQLITLLIIFISILGLTYIVTKKIARVKQGGMREKNLQIMEGLQIGQGQYLYIIRIGESYHLMSGTKEQINYCIPLDEKQLEFEQPVSHSFNDYLEHFKRGKQESKNEDQ